MAKTSYYFNLSTLTAHVSNLSATELQRIQGDVYMCAEVNAIYLDSRSLKVSFVPAIPSHAKIHFVTCKLLREEIKYAENATLNIVRNVEAKVGKQWMEAIERELPHASARAAFQK
jgi:hypothetical protein